MPDARIAAFQGHVATILDHLKGEFAKLQTGRASPALVEHILVEAYGQRQELRTVAGISVPEARMIVIQPWDRSLMGAIEAGLSKADIGSSPVNDGAVLRISLPPMTEERRKQLAKVVRQLAEDSRISVRQKRQEIHDAIKTEEKDEDARYTLIDELQKEVEKANAGIETLTEGKEKEILTV